MIKLAACILSACFATGMFAQDLTGTIEGSVLDPAGAVVAKAKVTITNTERNQVVRTAMTSDTGIYSAPFLPVGTYSVKVEAAGFKTHEQSQIVINVADVLKINFTLQVGA